MNPPVEVRKVHPRCARCGSNENLIRGDGPTVCRDCVRMAVRLAGITAPPLRNRKDQ